jgi:hypothetical protein
MNATPELAEATVRRGEDSVRLSELWRDRPALLLWVRHFG